MMNNQPPMATPSPARTPGKRRGQEFFPQTPSTVDREQALRDYKLTIEYKHLKQHCPGGVYLIPSFDDIRLFHGVIFVRRGSFTNGIFKFTLECDPKYNDRNLHPKVTFSSYVYNPHVHPDTGEVDLRIAYPVWDSSKHYLVTALTYVKRIFYRKDYNEVGEDEEAKFPNQEALRLFKTDPDAYRRRVQECVRESQRSVFLNDPGCTIRFKEEEKSYEIFRDIMRQRFMENDGGDSYPDDVCRMVTADDTLQAIEQAQRLARGEEEG
ncbi:hypothetical protein ACHAWX_006936 [Stephanocyclus meneghinianus]